MSMRLSEVHPALVHFPIALLPVAIAADAVGVATKNRELLAVGKWGMYGTALSAALAGIFGFIAQEEVNVEGEARETLQTHRTLNIGALAVATTLALVRGSRRKPGLGYLLAGLGTIAAVTYSAYLGGKLVYAHGAGVERADGIYGDAPELTFGNAGHAASKAVKDLGKGVWHAAQDMARGDIAPALVSRAR